MILASLPIIAFLILCVIYAVGSHKRTQAPGNSQSPKLPRFFTPALVIVLCILLYEFIYLLFYKAWGPPPPPEINHNDWLGFSGSYLEFAGSLIMAWLVYKQDQRINKLTEAEYRGILTVGIDDAAWSDCHEDEYAHEVGMGPERVTYNKLDLLCDPSQKNGRCGKCLYLYLSIKNFGKLPVTGIRFQSINIREIGSTAPRNHVYSFDRTDNSPVVNALNGKYLSIPQESLRILIVFHDFPQSLPLSTVEIKLSDDQDLLSSLHSELSSLYIIRREDSLFITNGTDARVVNTI